MCTLSIIRVESPGEPAGLRVVMNRDESRERPEALYPRWRDLAGGGRAIWPTDPTGGGTWIAATGQGLVLCLLNLNLEPRPVLPTSGLVSRGQVIPRVAQASCGKDVVEAVGRMNLTQFAPFRLVVAERGGSVWECRWDRGTLSITEHGAPPPPLCFVSSGLGDSKVGGRLRLFETEMAGCGGSIEAQDRFHIHAWPGRTDISVLMSRDEARTVSITTVEVGGPVASPTVRMHYQPVPEAVSSLGTALAGDRKARPVAASGLKR